MPNLKLIGLIAVLITTNRAYGSAAGKVPAAEQGIFQDAENGPICLVPSQDIGELAPAAVSPVRVEPFVCHGFGFGLACPGMTAAVRPQAARPVGDQGAPSAGVSVDQGFAHRFQVGIIERREQPVKGLTQAGRAAVPVVVAAGKAAAGSFPANDGSGAHGNMLDV